ncbi:hypothetical protein [Pseudoxanthomonas wuyuanensis]
MHRIVLILALTLLALAGCAAPVSVSPTAGEGSQASESAPRPAPPMSSPTPPRQVQAPVEVDYSCRSNADCAVKDVGNCCGSMPACVNRDSPTNPQAVQAQCSARGLVGVCGFREISACQCVSGRCEPDPASDASQKVPVQ